MRILDFFRNRTKFFTFKDRYGKSRIMTAKNIYNNVMEQSKKSDYNWIASAKELVKLCDNQKFPREYAVDIEMAILSCFANIEARVNRGGDKHTTKSDDSLAVQYCYDELGRLMKSSDNEEFKNTLNSVRTRYLKEMISSAVNTSTREYFFRCKAFRDLQDKVISRNFIKYSMMEKSFNLLDMYEEIFNETSIIFREANNSKMFRKEESAMFGIVKALNTMFGIANAIDQCKESLGADIGAMSSEPNVTLKGNQTKNNSEEKTSKGITSVEKDILSK